MKAFIVKNINEPPSLESVAFPTLKDDEVYLKIQASALNHRDVWITKGQYPNIRIGAIMGSDACGTSGDESYIINPGLHWGANQTFQSPDFRVLGVPDDGTFTEHIAINRKYLYPKPAHLTNVEAAALPLAGVTAYRALNFRASLKSGEKVLISGIGGGVALFAMQFALALGCTVAVTSGADSKIAEAVGHGASAGYIYHDADWPKKLMADMGGVDVIIDGACGHGFNQLTRVCNPGARIVFYGGTAGKINGLSPQPLFWKQISVLGSTMGSDSDFGEMISFVNQHKIKPIIDTVLPFDCIPQGFIRMEEGKQFGKIVFEH